MTELELVPSLSASSRVKQTNYVYQLTTQFYKQHISLGDIGPNGPNITALCSKLNGPVTQFANKLATKVCSSLQDQWNNIRTKESFLITLLNCIVDGINAINNEEGNAMQI